MKLGNISSLFDFLPKSKIKAGAGQSSGEYPMYTSSENQTKYLDQYNYEAGCLVFGTGGKASVHLATSRFATSTDCITIRPKPDANIDARYVFQYLKSNIQILENGFKGAGLKHISKSYLSEIRIPYPENINDQRKISTLLNRVDELITSRKNNLQQLDNFLKSVFLEMFGPKNQDFSNWPLVEMKSLAEKHRGAMRTGPFGSNLKHDEFSEIGDVAVLGIDNAVQNKFAWDKKRYITKEKYEELKNYTIYPGDVIVTIMGTIGRTAVIPKDIPLAINTKHLAAITLDKKLANPYFISFSIHSSPYILSQLKSKTRGAIMDGLNLGIIKETKLRRPPIELQNKFSEILLKVESIKINYQENLNELENLCGALSQKAFKGELDLSCVPLPEVSEAKVIERKLSDQIAVTDQIRIVDYPMSVPEERTKLLRNLFDEYLSHKKGEVLSLDDFWQQASFKTIDMMDEFDKPWGVEDYDQVKIWLFDMIRDGSIGQEFVSNAGSPPDGEIVLKAKG
ncbi:MAG: restriction endonuclease subunit S [Porticoccaceae bacterium]